MKNNYSTNDLIREEKLGNQKEEYILYKYMNELSNE